MASPLLTSTGVLRFGGNSVRGEYFAGRIDEVRLYNRALAATEIQADMAAPIGDGHDTAGPLEWSTHRAPSLQGRRRRR